MKKWLIIYDIRDIKRLQRVAKVMTNYAVRVQKSVFEAEANEAQIKRIRREVKSVMDVGEDYVVYFSLCEADWQKREKYGPGKYDEGAEKPYYIFE